MSIEVDHSGLDGYYMRWGAQSKRASLVSLLTSLEAALRVTLPQVRAQAAAQVWLSVFPCGLVSDWARWWPGRTPTGWQPLFSGLGGCPQDRQPLSIQPGANCPQKIVMSPEQLVFILAGG